MARNIAFVTFEEGQSLDLTGPFEVFAGANTALARRGRAPAYTLEVAAKTSGPVVMSSGLAVVATRTIARLPKTIDTLIVAGGAGARRAAASDGRLVAAIGRAAARARRVASVCTGSFVLAAAGLLDGRRATTHWAFCPELASRFPRVEVDPDPIYVHDGRVWTSAGVTAGIDLALAMVEADLGHDLAAEIARHLVVFVRRAGGQSQFSAPLRAQAEDRGALGDLPAFVAEHPEAALDVPSLAKRTGMSIRNFSRVFRRETGQSPASYVEAVRLEAARRLLESTSRSIDEVAVASGFGTPKSLHRAFARRIGVSPREYRARFGATHERGGGPWKS